ncbi:hypothetical protein EBT25_09530 [bacterium]|nr:hypothetical protein [bacterium]
MVFRYDQHRTKPHPPLTLCNRTWHPHTFSFLILVGMHEDNFSFMNELDTGTAIAIWYSLLVPIAIQGKLFLKEKRILPIHEYYMPAGIALTKAFVLHLGAAMTAYVIASAFATNVAKWIGAAFVLPFFTSVMGEMVGFAFVILPATIATRKKK